MSIPNPNPNIADGLKCDNKTYSSNKIEEMIQGASGHDTRIPDAAVSDIGKVLGIVSDGSTGAEYEAVSIPSPLPDPAVGDIGKVVSVVSDGESGAEYDLSTPRGGVFDVTLSTNQSMDLVVNKTFSEILAAYNQGKTVRLIADMNDEYIGSLVDFIYSFMLVSVGNDTVNNTYYLSFVGANYFQYFVTLDMINIDESNNVTKYTLYSNEV